MKARIDIVTAQKEFSEDQKYILKRVLLALKAHDLSVELVTNKKKQKTEPYKLRLA